MTTGSVDVVRNSYLIEEHSPPDAGSDWNILGPVRAVRGQTTAIAVWAEWGAENTFHLSNLPGRVVGEDSIFRNAHVGCGRVVGGTRIRYWTTVMHGRPPGHQ